MLGAKYNTIAAPSRGYPETVIEQNIAAPRRQRCSHHVIEPLADVRYFLRCDVFFTAGFLPLFLVPVFTVNLQFSFFDE